MIRHNHPNLKGSFTCLGNWYNILDIESMATLKDILKCVNATDKKTGTKEIERQKIDVQFFYPDIMLDFLYRAYRNENKDNESKLLKVDFLKK